MYERMLDKSHKPSMQDMTGYCGAVGELFNCLNQNIAAKYDTELEIRFPYGSRYGWGIKHKHKSKHICDIFAEKDAFTLMIRLTNKQIQRIYPDLSAYTKEQCDHKYPCGVGGWLNYRVTSMEQIDEVFMLLDAKLHK